MPQHDFRGLSCSTGLPVWSMAGLILVAHILVAGGSLGQTIDTLILGDNASEAAHHLKAAFPPPTEGKLYTYPKASDPSQTPPSEVLKGAMNEPARRLLPRSPVQDMYGGELNFVLQVDPVNQNYFTAKLWGSDQSESELILNCENQEIGRRHGNSMADMFMHHGRAWLPGRFWYRTAALPLKLTQGKQTVAIKLRSAGKIYDYNNKAYTPNYQYLMKAPSWQIYRVYTHVGGFVDISGEVQGTPPSAPIRTTPGPVVLEAWKEAVNSRVKDLVKKKGITGNDFPAVCRSINYFAQTYDVPWTAGYHNPEVIAAIVQSVDRVVTAYAAKNDLAGGDWGGAFGPMGEGISRVYPAIKDQMSAKIEFAGNIGTVTRTEGWAKALRASVDAGRLHRRTISNQEVFSATSIYGGNMGLIAVDRSKALAEAEARRYLYEAAGLSPFLGDDQPGDGPVPVRGKAPFGPDWFMVTTKGTTKEPSFVGSDYGEMGPRVYEMGRMANDRKLMEQGLKMIRARANFRFPGVDKEGYLVMTASEPIGARNNFLPGHDVYITRDVSNTGASIVAHEDAADLTGWFDQQLAEGQVYAMMAGGTSAAKNDIGRNAGLPLGPFVPDDLAAAMAKPRSGIKMPMAIGAADFAWGDEENMVVAAKHGEERFFANMVWRGTTSINGAGMVFLITPQLAVRAEVQVDDVRFVPTGQFENGSDSVDSFGWLNPPDHALYPNAEAGNRYPIAVRPDLAGHPPAKNYDGGRGTGYTLCYGHWLVGINGNYTTGDYSMKLPPDFASATDLITGKVLNAPVVIQKGQTVVFYLPRPTSIPAATKTKSNVN